VLKVPLNSNQSINQSPPGLPDLATYLSPIGYFFFGGGGADLPKIGSGDDENQRFNIQW